MMMDISNNKISEELQCYRREGSKRYIRIAYSYDRLLCTIQHNTYSIFMILIR